MQTAIDYKKQITEELNNVPEEKLSDLARIVHVFADAPEDDKELELLDARWEAYEKTGRGVPHEDVVAWLTSWGKDNELPCPSIK